ncbi:hypothetical protein [Bordetella genomosp. 11]|uniref:Uncharacterized protein n=1 Tax=Bordetella genomosp. 11 TaxID=1416808 RepID=A0A261ULD9_9BORD|nr:hypothetical protein [Bordetella genomosp. 11]OZI62090.1 hypothetical protein CAL28_22970 [Bordetella genomosp. 11]
MKPALFDEDLSQGFREGSPECLQPGVSFDTAVICLFLAVFTELEVSEFHRTEIRVGLEPASSGLASGSGCGGEYERRAGAAHRRIRGFAHMHRFSAWMGNGSQRSSSSAHLMARSAG